MNKLSSISIFLCVLLFACENSEKSTTGPENPPAPGFNVEASDEKAIALADSVMVAMGGRKAWDNTVYLKWNFFNARRHIWNKHTNEVVIEGIRDTFRIQMNLDNMTGSVTMDGRNLTKADSLDKYLEKGKSWWINDSYWIAMPFKLKDSGVTLRYVGRDTTKNGVESEVLSLTFNEVGDTPQNKYQVYVDPDTKLVSQWDFYINYQDTVPRFSTPWEDYQQYGEIMLSSSRGGNRKITEIAVGPDLQSYFE